MEGTFNTHKNYSLTDIKRQQYLKKIIKMSKKKQHTGRKANVTWLFALIV